jgi:hypothetical protein
MQLFNEPGKLIHRGDAALEFLVRHRGGPQEHHARRDVLGDPGLSPYGNIVADRDVIDNPDLAGEGHSISDLRAT